MKSIVTKADMQLVQNLFPFVSPEQLPLSFVYDGKPVRGIPATLHPLSPSKKQTPI